MSDVIPRYFSFTHFESFTRQLNAWGFKRMYRVGPGEKRCLCALSEEDVFLTIACVCISFVSDFGAYYHQSFLRGKPELTRVIRRTALKNGKAKPHPEGEPDLYAIAEQFPLPQIADIAQGPVARETMALAPLASSAAVQAALPSVPARDSTEPSNSNVHYSSQGIPQDSFSGPPEAHQNAPSPAYAHGTETYAQMMPYNFSPDLQTAAAQGLSQAVMYPNQSNYGSSLQYPYPTTHEPFSVPPAAALPDATFHTNIRGTDTLAPMMQGPSHAAVSGQSYGNNLQHPYPMAYGQEQPMIQNQQPYNTQIHYQAPAPGGYQVPSFPTSQQHGPAFAQVDFASASPMMQYPYIKLLETKETTAAI